MRIGILQSRDTTLAFGSKQDALAVAAVGDEVRAIHAACAALGWTALDVEASRDPQATLENLMAARADVVFHLAESIGGEARFEAAAAWLCEWARIPYTGSGPVALTLALLKPHARAVLAAAGVPTPFGFTLERADAPWPDAFTSAPPGRAWIVKPSREDASHGIELASVVRTEAELRARADHVIRTYRQSALVEEFVDGREFNVSLVAGEAGVLVLPLAEIDFSGFPADAPRLVTFQAKWDESSAEYQGSPAVPARELAGPLERAVRARALAAWQALDLAGYGRIDLRLDPERGPLVLDVNPNPDLSPDAGLARAAARGGLPYAQLIERIVRDALRRHRTPA